MVVLWLIVMGLSRWNLEHVDGMDGVRANFGANFSWEHSEDHGETPCESFSLCKLWHFGRLE